MNISVVIPTINSEKIIEKTVRHIDHYMKRNKNVKKYEIIIAAQTSKDKTFQIIKKLKSRSIKPLFINDGGKGIGLTTGIKKASFPWVVMIDDDLSYPIEFLNDAIEKSKNNEIIIGSRYLTKQNMPFIRKIASFLYRKLVNFLFGFHVKDPQAGLKLIKKSIFKKIRMEEKGFVWDTELLYKAKKLRYGVAEVPIKYDFRKNVLRVRKAAPKMLKNVVLLRLRTLKR